MAGVLSDSGSNTCACDKNDGQWRSDHGSFRDLSELPIKELQFGDIDELNEDLDIILTPMQCKGMYPHSVKLHDVG